MCSLRAGCAKNKTKNVETMERPAQGSDVHCAVIWGFIYWAKVQLRDGGATGRCSIGYEEVPCQVARCAMRN